MNATEWTARFYNLKEELERLRKLDIDKKVYGASLHQYRMKPVLNEAEIREFETFHSVDLPEDYRAFLQYIGNGGAGPGTGLMSLEEAIAEQPDLCSPFPFVKKSRSYRLGIPGYLNMAHQGCGYFEVLVVSGEQRGRMWFDGRAGEGAAWSPLGLDFVSWYHKWLLDAIAEIEK